MINKTRSYKLRFKSELHNKIIAPDVNTFINNEINSIALLRRKVDFLEFMVGQIVANIPDLEEWESEPLNGGAITIDPSIEYQFFGWQNHNSKRVKVRILTTQDKTYWSFDTHGNFTGPARPDLQMFLMLMLIKQTESLGILS